MPAGVSDKSSATRTVRGASSRIPCTRVTRYDIASSALLAMVLMLAIIVITLIAIWLANRLPTRVLLAPVMTAGEGGWEDGTPDATLNVESPEDPSDDPSVAEELSSVTELLQISDPLAESAEAVATLIDKGEFTDPNNSGNLGSAEGTGGRPLGSGGPGRGGVKREQRWFVEFADRGDLTSYAQQLDFFKIELGLLFLNEGRLIYLSELSKDHPKTREVRTGESEKRLYMNWEGGDRKEADAELFRKAGINPSGGNTLHFYPAELENLLAQLEVSHAGQPPEKIRRTYFTVNRTASGFKFAVKVQKYK
jgi:hypothetical protein